MIKIKAKEYDPDLDNYQVELFIRHSKNYPFEIPMIQIYKKKNLTSFQMKMIENLIHEKMNTLLGTEMIYDICEAVKVKLDFLLKNMVFFFPKHM